MDASNTVDLDETARLAESLVRDGATGIILGLFICSRPAANGIDLFFQDRLALRQLVSTMDGVTWFLLNTIVMIVGWLVISVGASRLTV